MPRSMKFEMMAAVVKPSVLKPDVKAGHRVLSAPTPSKPLSPGGSCTTATAVDEPRGIVPSAGVGMNCHPNGGGGASGGLKACVIGLVRSGVQPVGSITPLGTNRPT